MRASARVFFIKNVAKIWIYEELVVSLQAKMGILVVILLVGAAMLLLCVRVILRKNGRFSSQHISQNKLMRERGIHCVNTQDYEARHAENKKINVKKL